MGLGLNTARACELADCAKSLTKVANNCKSVLVNIFFVTENFKTLVKGHEPVLCEAPKFCWSFLKIYYVKLRGP